MIKFFKYFVSGTYLTYIHVLYSVHKSMRGKQIPIVVIWTDKPETRFFNNPAEAERYIGVERRTIYSALRSPSGRLKGTSMYVDYACADFDVERYEMKGDDKLDYGL